MKNSRISLYALLLATFSLFFFFFGYKAGKRAGKRAEKIDTTFVEVKHIAPTPQAEKPAGIIRVPIRTTKPSSPAIPKAEVKVFTPAELDSALNDTVTVDTARKEVVLPITQKEYRDSDYTAYVSGYKAKLDSIKVVSRVITKTEVKTEVKHRRWSVGLIGGYGFGFGSKTFQPFLGVGLAWNLVK